MADPAFDTLEAARRLEAADIQAEQADVIVEVVHQPASQMVAVERFEAAIARFDTSVAGLHARIDSVHSELSARIDSVHSDLRTRIDSGQAELLARIDSVRSELRAEIARYHVRTLIVAIAANTLIVTIIATVATIFGILLTGGSFGTGNFGVP